VRQRHGRMGPWFRAAVMVIKPLSTLFTRRDWRGAEHIPQTGGVIVAANHVSHLDPLTLGHFVYDSGRLPRYLAKSELYEGAFLGRLLRGAEQIPVYRRSPDATHALSDAIDAVRRGECLLIYPEGTITKDPAGWPMLARTGVARLALATGAPVVPVAQWGIQDVLPAYTKDLRLLPRKTVRVWAGPPVDLSAWQGKDPTADVLRQATDAVMAAIRDMVGQMRGEQPSPTAFDPRRAARPAAPSPAEPALGPNPASAAAPPARRPE
jgi:1-acyl-sn-glycerol-3-phosphate acyltransferase